MNSQQFTQWRQQWLMSHTYQSPLIMGIINLTPDSFSDGGRLSNIEHALAYARKLLAEGADLLDIGGESSRPGAKPVSIEEEIARVVPLIERLRQETDCCISIDTVKPEVMQAAVSAGANFINDITALKNEAALKLVAKLQLPVCLMHMQGIPENMQNAPAYYDILTEINDFFQARIAHCIQAGIKRDNIILDPGFGFGKTVQHNLKIIKYLDQFKQHKLPLLLGVSRKSTIGAILNKNIGERLIGGITVNVLASLKRVDIIRTHDVDETKQALLMIQAITQADNNFEGNME